MGEYLLKEYELCFQQLRFYDERHGDLLKYLFTLTSSVATAQFAVYKFTQGPTYGFFAAQAFLSGLVFIATLLIYLAMLQNRLYFYYVARQLNAIRGFLMRTAAGEFRNNQLYTSTNFAAVKPSSVHSFQLLGAAFISSLFAGLSISALGGAVWTEPCVGGAAVTAIVIAIAEIGGGVRYLAVNSKKTADQAIHASDKEMPEQEREPDA